MNALPVTQSGIPDIYRRIHRYEWSLLALFFFFTFLFSLFFLLFDRARLPAPYRDTQRCVCVKGLRNAFSLYDGYFKYAACTTSCYTGRACRFAIKKKRKRGHNCSGACNMYNAVSIVTLVLTLNRLFGKPRNRSECGRTGKNVGNFICN